MYVVSEEKMQNKQLVTDEILTHSNAYVKSFHVVESFRDSDGLYNIKGVATVETRKLTDKLGELEVESGKVGSKEFKAVTYSRFDQAQGVRDVYDRLIFAPLRNGSATDIESIGFNPIDYYPGRVFLPRGFEKRQIEQGELLPFKVVFKTALCEQYRADLVSVLDNTADKKEFNPLQLFLKDEKKQKGEAAVQLADLKVNTDYNKYSKKWKYSLAKVGRKTFPMNQDKWSAFTSLFDGFFESHVPFLSISLLSGSGGAIGRVVFKGSGGDFDIVRDQTDFPAGKELGVGYEHSTLFSTDKVDLRYSNGDGVGCVTGVWKRGYGFVFNDLDEFVVVYLGRDQVAQLSDVQIALRWAKQ